MPYIAECGYVSNQEAYDYRAAQGETQERAEMDALMADIAYEAKRLEYIHSCPVIATFELDQQAAQQLASLDDCESDFVKVTVYQLEDSAYWYELEYSTDPFYQEIDMAYDDAINHRELTKLLITKAVNPEYVPLPR